MRWTIRVVAVLAAAAVVGCTDAPSAPETPAGARAERLTVPPASDIGDSTGGGCRSGYAIINGRCEPVNGG